MIRYTKEYIERLIDKYMDGKTTLEEEDLLASYFRGKDVPKEWSDYQQLFQEIERLQVGASAGMTMKPQPQTGRRWISWSIAAAAVIGGMIFLLHPSSPTAAPQGNALMAGADTLTTLPKEERPVKLVTDTVTPQLEQSSPTPPRKRSKRKIMPTIHDYDKAYALMASALLEQEEAERQVEESRLATVKALMESMGYASIRHEDGTIEFIDENLIYTAYEE